MGAGIIHSDDEIFKLIECDKIIPKKPPVQKQTNRDLIRKFDVISTDGSSEFEVFFAQNVRLPEDFSVGLIYGKSLLIRYNGFHGTTIAGFHKYEHHADAHAHTLTFDDVMNGRESHPSKIEDMTGNYYDFESAQLFLLRNCGILNYEEYFDFTKYSQMSFDDL